jgi:hypothetical protein
MNRRKFIATIGALAALPSLPVLAIPAKPRDRFEILSPEEISEHFVYVPKPTFETQNSLGESERRVVKTYFMRGMTYGTDWFRPDGSVNERERRRLASEAVPYIKKWFSFYTHVWRDRADVFGPYVHNVRLCNSPCCGPDGRLVYAAMMRVDKVVVRY